MYKVRYRKDLHGIYCSPTLQNMQQYRLQVSLQFLTKPAQKLLRMEVTLKNLVNQEKSILIRYYFTLVLPFE